MRQQQKNFPARRRQLPVEVFLFAWCIVLALALSLVDPSADTVSVNTLQTR
jgi:hypothetical protein